MPISDLGGMERGSRLTMAMNFGHLANKGGGVPPQIGYCLRSYSYAPFTLNSNELPLCFFSFFFFFQFECVKSALTPASMCNSHGCLPGGRAHFLPLSGTML